MAFITIGAVFLAVTGAEALYVDLGHFGRRPIVLAWLAIVFPSLLLNYFGQGAFVLSHGGTPHNPFFEMLPDWALVPMVVLATAATVIASQAVISGAYSLTRQAVQLSILPRFEIQHTSEMQSGQIYLPRVNLLLGARRDAAGRRLWRIQRARLGLWHFGYRRDAGDDHPALRGHASALEMDLVGGHCSGLAVSA